MMQYKIMPISFLSPFDDTVQEFDTRWLRTRGFVRHADSSEDVGSQLPYLQED